VPKIGAWQKNRCPVPGKSVPGTKKRLKTKGLGPKIGAWHEEKAENKRFRSDLGGVLLVICGKYGRY
jgi:hypothetical protein